MHKKSQNELVKELFSFLGIAECNESGSEFYPVHITCCRAMMIEPLNECLVALKESIKESE